MAVLFTRTGGVGFGVGFPEAGEGGPDLRSLPDPVEHVVVVGEPAGLGQPGIVEQLRRPAASPARSAAYSARSAAGSSPGIFRARMTRGSVRPWASRVVPATTNAMSTTWGRSGVFSGSDWAAATVITPRIPDQASTTPPRQPKPSDTK